MGQATAHCHLAQGHQQEGDFLSPGIYHKQHGLHNKKGEPKLNTVFGRMNNRRLEICTTYLRLLFIAIPVTVVSIPVVMLPSILPFSSVNPTSSINRVFCGVHTYSAFYAASFVSSASAAKRIFQSWNFQNWHKSHLTVSASLRSAL